MLREPYNLNPYNSTIDTSLVQPFSFVFSGDKLGSYQIQMAENNKGGNPLYTSPVVDVDDIYDGDVVTTYLPDIIQSNVNIADGRLYYIYRIKRIAPINMANVSTIALYYYHNGVAESTPFATVNIFRNETVEEPDQETRNDLIVLLSTGYGFNFYIACQCFNISGEPFGGMYNNLEMEFSNYQLQIVGEVVSPGGQGVDPVYSPPISNNSCFQIGSYVYGVDAENPVSQSVQTDGYLNVNLTFPSDSATEDDGEKYYQVFDSYYVNYILYESLNSSYTNLLGHDIIWRVLQWEPKIAKVIDDVTTYVPGTTNFVRNGQIIAKTSNDNSSIFSTLKLQNEIGVLVPLLESYEIANISSVTRHCFIDETASNIVKKSSTAGQWEFYIPITYARTNYEDIASDFEFAIIDNIYFTISGVETFEDVDHTQYYKFTLVEVYNGIDATDKRELNDGNFYGYELILKNGIAVSDFDDDLVTYTYYTPQTETVGGIGYDTNFSLYSYATGQRMEVSIESPLIYTYAEYSTGNVRGYLSGNILDSIDFPIEGVYQLYSNFAFSNWTFFEARKSPDVVLSFIGEDGQGQLVEQLLPENDYIYRSIKVNATYIQDDFIPIRYHRWVLYDSLDNIVQDSGQIYDSDLSFELSPLSEVENYKIVFTVVNQNNVVIERQTTLTTYFPNEVLESGAPKVDNDEHIALVSWPAALSAVPSANSRLPNPLDYGNRISITSLYRDIALKDNNSLLLYDSISGAPFADSIHQDDFVFRVGLIINDKLQQWSSTADSPLIKFINNDGIFDLRKNQYYLNFYDDGILIQEGTTTGIDVNNKYTLKVLIPTVGICKYPTSVAHRSMWFMWLDDDAGTEEYPYWVETYEDEDTQVVRNYYWVDETTSDTNEYYYQIIFGGKKVETEQEQEVSVGILTAYRTPYQRGIITEIESQENNNEIIYYVTVPYNNLLTKEHNRNSAYIRMTRTPEVPIPVTLVDNKDGLTMTVLLDNSADVFTTGEYVLYLDEEEQILDGQYGAADSTTMNSFQFSGDINLFYAQLFSQYPSIDETHENTSLPLDFSVKPWWNSQHVSTKSQQGEFIALTFNDVLTSHQGGSGDTEAPTTDYEIYRVKYQTREDAENQIIEDNNDIKIVNGTIKPIYSQRLGKINLNNEHLQAASQILFKDWTIENNGWFRYKIIPLGSEAEPVIWSTPFQTTWYGWSFTAFTSYLNHYIPIEHWVYYLNLETKGYSHVTNKVFHQGFSRYPKASIGPTDYITSDLTGLIGEFKQVMSPIPHNEYLDDNIERIYRWENFTNDGTPILVKDYKGRTYIAQLDGGANNFNDVDNEILTTISFNITQVDDTNNYFIFEAGE